MRGGPTIAMGGENLPEEGGGRKVFSHRKWNRKKVFPTRDKCIVECGEEGGGSE